MMRIALLSVAGVLTVGNMAWSAEPEAEAPEVPAVLNFEMKSLAGEPVKLSRYHGKVALMVNTASRCGLTGQYKQLQALHEKYAEQGLSILGFPANNFGRQEPGTDTEIATFCKENYGVAFDMFSKVSVKGEDQCDLYKFLTREETNGQFAGPIKWNFTKFLIGRDGKVVARFEPRTKPDSDQVIQAIERELAKPDPTADQAKS